VTQKATSQYKPEVKKHVSLGVREVYGLLSGWVCVGEGVTVDSAYLNPDLRTKETPSFTRCSYCSIL
jgi:hypothetical protein